ncbi:ATP-dependent Clp protease ATP-binding subunit [Candidatus Peregrinibacteria bacterium]|nr:ATP-dependent Clp protease ATP-binding subunit [Candidatus Peregrinibacteria bacterium]
MPTSYSSQIENILQIASIEALKENASYVKKEHVFLAILKQNDEEIDEMFKEFKISKEEFIQSLTKIRRETTDVNDTKIKNIGFDAELKKTLEEAKKIVETFNDKSVKSIHLFMILTKDPSKRIQEALKNFNLSYEKIYGYYEKSKKRQKTEITTFLDQYGDDLTQKAIDGKLDPIIDRFEETERIIQILSRKTKNNPVLFGGPGVGKTGIVEGIAYMIAKDKVPENLKNKRIIELSIHSIIAGASLKGEFEERLKNILEEVKKSDGKIIIFFDEIHSLVQKEDNSEAANILKPALARGEIQCIGATTESEYRKHFEKDAALERRFQPVYIEEPSEENCLIILKGIKKKFENYHKILIPDEILEDILRLSQRYIVHRLLPDKAIDLLDEACTAMNIPEFSLSGQKEAQKFLFSDIIERKEKATMNKNIPLANKLSYKARHIEAKILSLEKSLKEKEKRREKILTREIVEEIVSKMTGIPKPHIQGNEGERLLHIEEILSQNIVGQNKAIKIVSEAIIRNQTGMKKKSKPIGSFIFMGPTGVGKTELAERLTEYLFGTLDALVRFDMSELSEKHTSARLIGAPPGYIGYEEGGQLTEIIRRRPYSVILFDEIEKAHPEIFNLLLQMLDEGHLTDAKGQKVNFENTIIICSSNLGGQTIDFAQIKSLNEREQKNTLIKELRTLLKPELINRFDDIILFDFLTKENIESIINLLIRDTVESLEEQNISFILMDSARKKLAELGYDPVFGARPARLVIQKEIDTPLAKMLLRKQLKEGDQITCQVENENFIFRKLTN